MKKKVLSLFVLIGCVSVFCLRFRKKADYLHKQTKNSFLHFLTPPKHNKRQRIQWPGTEPLDMQTIPAF